MSNRKIKIFDHCWHVHHQNDMIDALKEDCEFYFCLTDFKQWPKEYQHSNLHFVTHYEPNTYDLAILHVDQRSVASRLHTSQIYHQFNELISDIPKVVINHGSAVYPWDTSDWYEDPDEKQKVFISQMEKVIGENTMVVNSFTAASEKEWGFGIPIVHGMNPDRWYDLPKEQKVFTAVSAGGLDDYYNRACLEEVKRELASRNHTLWHAQVNVWTGMSKDRYRNFLGTSLIYLDTTFRTPMNRARTEAMLSGCCVIQVEGAHDLDMWAKPGENIVIVPNNPVYIAETVVDFLENRYNEAIQIGQNGKIMASTQFSVEKYRTAWLNLISTLI